MVWWALVMYAVAVGSAVASMMSSGSARRLFVAATALSVVSTITLTWLAGAL